MPKLILSRREFVEMLRGHGFLLKRQVGSHQQWEGTVDGRRRLVTVDISISEFSGWLLKRMIHQAGLPKSAFRPRR